MRRSLILLAPIICLYLGIALNAICTCANGGVMPVRSVNCAAVFGDNPDSDPLHTCMTPQSKMKVLGDVLTQGDGLYSIGDQFIDLGHALKWPCLLLWSVATLFALVRPSGRSGHGPNISP